MRKTLDEDRISHIRLCWADQHGVVRAKTLTRDSFLKSMEDGKDFPSLTIFDTGNYPVLDPFATTNALQLAGITGLPDCRLIPDPATYRPLPWVPGTAWVLGDMSLPEGEPDPLCTRRILRQQTERLARLGYEMLVGLELEFHVYRTVGEDLDATHSTKPPQPPAVMPTSHGHQYLSETCADEIDAALQRIRECLVALGLPLAGVDPEWGPSQCEVVFEPMPALEAADAALLARSAIKQVMRRQGFHASFMTFPQVPNTIPSGWHLHQSLRKRSDGSNAFTDHAPRHPLSKIGMQWLGGLKSHACGGSLLAMPTVNGYKRLRPGSLAPIAANWGCENRGTMLRVIGAGRSDAHIENRAGEPCANPYLYIAGQIVAGLDGIARDLDPGQPSAAGYSDDAPALPRDLGEAIAAFAADDVLRDQLGDAFSRYFIHLKQHELRRFMSEVTDWEQREYFAVF